LKNSKHNIFLRFCKRCLTPDSRPRIEFNKNGICNGCITSDKNKKIDWKSREKEFLELIDNYRSKEGGYDCVVPWSGGKDSSSIAYKLKHVYGLNPLLVTFSPLIFNDVGIYNREQMIQNGFDSFLFRPNQTVSKKLSKRFFIERGDPKVHWNAGVNVIPVKIAIEKNIKLIFYAEDGESEYGGKIISEEQIKVRGYTEIIEQKIGDDPKNWITDDITLKDLTPYIYPDPDIIEKINIKVLHFSYFFKWDIYKNYKFIKDKIDFKTEPNKRTIGTFTDFDSLDDKIDDLYYYMQFIKFGFGRCIRDASRLIQNNHLTRQKGLEYVKKYDGEFPSIYLKETLNYLDMNLKEFKSCVDKHRNDEIWEKNSGKWILRNQAI